MSLASGGGGAHLELLDAIGQTVPHGLDIQRTQRIFVNRNLKMAEVEVIGFDMDYTLALYHQPSLEALSIKCTADKLIAQRGYPREILDLTYDPKFAVRGLVVDRQNGNVAKMDRYGHVGRVYHGRRELDRDERHSVYRQAQRVRLSSPRYAWIDTLFALPEAVMYAAIIDLFEGRGQTVDYNKLWQDIRDSIDEAHRDETMKRDIKANLAEYIVRDPELAPTLHKFRSAGKRLFLLTNSALDYTEPVMSYLLDGVLPAYPTWRHYFDVISVSARKPAFFTDSAPFVELDAVTGQPKPGEVTQLVRGRLYEGGNVKAFENMLGASGDRLLYIGDHIYGDMLRAKKSSVWRTAMVVQELEHELIQVDRMKDRIRRIEKLERQASRLDADVTYQQMLLKTLQRMVDHPSREHDAATLEQAKAEAKRRLDELKAALKNTTEELDKHDHEVDSAFNPYWGTIFREGAETSRFGEQVDNYACVYTSRVSNFLYYSPLRYFRSMRDHMPHEKY